VHDRGQFNAAHEADVGNFELCVAANGQIEHWIGTAEGSVTGLD
jgi:hypothetical protein